MNKEVLDVMKALGPSGITMVVVTHEMGFARKCGSGYFYGRRTVCGRRVLSSPPGTNLNNPQNTDRCFLSKIL
jgi:ABC-type polar amino acid transport system ATPase subunit